MAKKVGRPHSSINGLASPNKAFQQEVYYYTLQSYSPKTFCMLRVKLPFHPPLRILQVVHSPAIHGAPTQPGLENDF